MTEPLLQADGLTVHCFTEAGMVKALDDLSFAVDRGEVLGLVGEGGSGKSLTGYSIMGLVDPPGRIMGGRITLAGQDLVGQSTEEMRQLRGNRIAMTFQNPMLSLNPVLRIEAQMLEAILAHVETDRPAARARAREALAELGVVSPDAALKAYPHQLSEGTRQRVAIAIASVNRPDLLIADEPAAGLDIALQGQIVLDMRRFTRETGAALIWMTRDLEWIAGFADRVCVMYAGRIVEQGATADVLSAPRHPYTRGLLDSMPGSVPVGEKLRQMTGTMPSRAELPPGCAFRPRCPYATAACGETPDLRPYGAAGQSIRCFHPLHAPAST